jgi:hypothetical protein
VTYTAIFRDGPLGGQYREVSQADHTFRVMVPPPIRATGYYAHHVGPCLELPEPEVYELVGAAGPVLDYRWVNPAEALRAEVRRLKAKLTKAQEQLRDVQRSLLC